MLSLADTFSNVYTSLTKTKVRVLWFHRVNKYGGYFGIDTDVFEQQIKYLSENYNLISIKDFLNILNREISIKKALLITFDDGYLDNYTDAYPILKKYSVPAIIFLTTDFIEGKMWMWHDLYRFIFNNTPVKIANITVDGTSLSFDIKNLKDRMNARKVVHNYCKKMSRAERLNFLYRLANTLEVKILDLPTKEYAPLSWDHVRELSKNGIDFGAHTISHEILSRLDDNDSYTEIIQSKKIIETKLKKEVKAFAYPNGSKDDFTDTTKKIVRESGCSCAFTMIEGINGINFDRYELMRFGHVDEYSSYFKAEVSGLVALKQRVNSGFRVMNRKKALTKL